MKHHERYLCLLLFLHLSYKAIIYLNLALELLSSSSCINHSASRPDNLLHVNAFFINNNKQWVQKRVFSPCIQKHSSFFYEEKQHCKQKKMRRILSIVKQNNNNENDNRLEDPNHDETSYRKGLEGKSSELKNKDNEEDNHEVTSATARITAHESLVSSRNSRKQYLSNLFSFFSFLSLTGSYGRQSEAATNSIDSRSYRERKKDEGRVPILEGYLSIPEGYGDWRDFVSSSMAPDDVSDPYNLSGKETLFLLVLDSLPDKSDDDKDKKKRKTDQNKKVSVVMAAKVPLQIITFPFLFQFYPSNLMKYGIDNKSDWETKDLVVRAAMCKDGNNENLRFMTKKNISEINESKEANGNILLITEGISKCIPYLENVGTNIRLAAPLFLLPPNVSSYLKPKAATSTQE